MRAISPFRSVFSRLGSLALLACAVCACAPAALPPAPPTPAPTLTALPAAQTHTPTTRHILVTATTSPTPAVKSPTLTPAPTQPDSGLILEEHELLYAPGFEPLTFAPRSGSQASILEKYASLKQPPFERRSDLINGSFLSYPVVGDDRTVARMIESGGKEVTGGTIPDVTVQIVRDQAVIFETSAGQVTPVTIVRGLWLDGPHWYLEIAYGVKETNGNPVTGQIYQEGVLLNNRLGSTEMFGFQFLGGKSFYFYQKDGRIHASYNGQDLPLEYEYIPHYNCCSSAELNPHSGPNWVGFFGRRGKTWYYTEILAP